MKHRWSALLRESIGDRWISITNGASNAKSPPCHKICSCSSDFATKGPVMWAFDVSLISEQTVEQSLEWSVI